MIQLCWNTYWVGFRGDWDGSKGNFRKKKVDLYLPERLLHTGLLILYRHLQPNYFKVQFLHENI